MAPAIVRCGRWMMVLVLVLIGFAPVSVTYAYNVDAPQPQATVTPGPCVDGTLPSGARSRICVPSSGWNGDLVVYAHGYVSPFQPVGFESSPEVGFLASSVQGLGYAFAATTYRRNGLAVLEGVQDMRELIAAFPSTQQAVPRRTFALGFSQGSLITTLLAERYPEAITGAVAACGPIGDFKRQTEYITDFRVLFDYYFPGVLPGSPISIPDELIANWESTYVPAITAALQNNPANAAKLIAASKAPIDPANLSSVAATTINILWYSTFATNDTRAQLGGNPYGNQDRFLDIPDLPRYTADVTATQALDQYQTTGRLGVRLTTLHTTGDPIVPIWHQDLYQAKVAQAGKLVTQQTIERYGHCNFQLPEITRSFDLIAQPKVFLPLTQWR